ncbi:3-keto-5-aminohexanoate cleavage protein [Oricola sp.]|uniref:3-keto-5-aminohexanoate cleavage protein n=1 Tax=Oricola sp. TaxID=1979950 RepID=UPI0025CE9C94|nr:3-keto-5-aminohexanoate cleavage protein [Oricola sp.]MCI5078400.1 3-keto-5-aminohexanoate cleavage protein [Oricola sp.]
MIVQACLNGARPAGFHPKLPFAAAAVAQDAVLCVAAGANELHVHPRDEAGLESLFAVDDTVTALRTACPGTLIGVSTGEWIEQDRDRTCAAIESWSERPDYASVNLSETDAPDVMATLTRRGIGIEAGLATAGDAARFVALPDRPSPLRILIEIEEQEPEAAFAAADAISDVLADAGLRRPILLHGFDAMAWPFVERAFERGWSTRIGLEDGRHLPDGTLASDNADLVRHAVALRARAA